MDFVRRDSRWLKLRTLVLVLGLLLSIPGTAFADALTVEFIVAADRAYDGTADAASLVGVPTFAVDPADGTTVQVDSATFVDKLVGVGKTVTVNFSFSQNNGGHTLTNATDATQTATITAVSVTPVLTANNKVYDRTVTATGSIALTGVLGGDTVTASAATTTFADKTVATGKTVTANTISLGGADAGNYTLSATSDTDTANITALALTVSLAANNKVYDANTEATGTLTLTGVIGGDTVTVSAATTTFADKTVATGKTVTANTISLGGADGTNYSVAASTTDTANITAVTVTPVLTANNKVYDRTVTATGTIALTGVLVGDTVTASAATTTFADKTAATGKTVTASTISLAGADAGNYSLSSTSDTDTANITAVTVTPVLTADNRVYDQTVTATGSIALTGVLGGDTVTASAATTTFADKTVATGKTVTASTISLAGTDAGNYTLSTSSDTDTADITALGITVSLTANDKVYDTTIAATGTLTLTGVIGGDSVTVSAASITFADKTVATGKTVTASGITLGDTDAGNYSVAASTTDTADITAVAVTASLSADDKSYDGNTTATGTFSPSGVLPLDTVTVSAASITFDTRFVGTGKTVTASGMTLGGADAGNYTLSPTSDTDTADITARAITVTAATDNKLYDGTTTSSGVPTVTSGTVVGGETTNFAQTFDTRDVGTNKTMIATGNVNGEANYLITFVTDTTGQITLRTLIVTAVADDKVYDSTTAATTSSLTGNTLGSDVITLTSITATFDNANVGTNKTVTVNGITIGGTHGGNYTLSADPVTDTADITARPITITAVTSTKEYDKTTSSSGTPVITSGALQGGDTISASAQTFDNANVGTGKTLTPTATISDGNSGNNYTVTLATVSTGTITTRALTITASSANSRVYDGTTATPGTPSITSGSLIAGDTLSSVDESYDNKNAGAGKTVTPTGTVNDGNGGANYTVTFVATTNNEITVRTLTVTASAADKDLDGTTTATVTLSDDRVAGDVLTLAFTSANFDTQFVGENKAVTVLGVAIAGTDAGNYTLASTTVTTTADINPALRLDTGARIWDSTSAVQVRGGPTTYLIAAELTGDNLIDIVNVTTSGAQILRNNGGTGTSLSVTLIQELDVRWSKGGNAIDVDGDGDLDLILGDVDHVKVATNDGTGLFVLSNPVRHNFRQPTVAEPFNSQDDPLHPNNEVRIALSSSSDTDVFQDLVGGSTDGRPRLYILQPDGSGGWQIFRTLDSFNVDGVVPHDRNGDGLTDLFVSNRSGVWSMRPAYVYVSSASGYTGDGTFDLSDFDFSFSFGPTDRVSGTNFGAFRTFAGYAVGSWHRLTVWNGTFGSWNAPLHISMDPGGVGGFATGEAWGSAFADMNDDGFVDIAAVGKTVPLTLMRLDSDPNSAVNRYVTTLQAGTSHDVKIRDFDFDANDAPDVIVGRSDGIWYYHNVNGASAGGGTATAANTGGEFLSTAIKALHAALDPSAANPIASDSTVFNNGTADTYFNGAAFNAGVALGHLQKIDVRFRTEAPNFVFGANTTQQIETLRQYHSYIGDALTSIATADALTSDPTDDATLASITSALMSAQADIIAQGQALGGAGSPFKRSTNTRKMARIKERAMKTQYKMLESMAAARNATDGKKRARLVRRADRQGRKALGYLRQYYKRYDKLTPADGE